MIPLADAIANLESELARTEGSPAGYSELGKLKLAAGDAQGAVAAFESCLATAGPNAGLLNNLGASLSKAGRHLEAIGALESALALQPRYLRALVNLGKALRESGRLQEAVDRLREALAIDHGYVPALVNMGDALAASGALSDAEHTFVDALSREPASVEARSSLGLVRLQAGRLGEALEDLRAAVALAPTHADAHANLGHALFGSGDWAAAWPHFEYRFRRSAQRASLHIPARMPRWDGEFTQSLELWLIGEQGLGDQLQFVRYAKLLGERKVCCVVACDPRLVELLSRSALGHRVVPFDTAAHNTGARWFPLLSLPAWHETLPETVPTPHGYLRADPRRIRQWKPRLPQDRFRVALAWAGNPRMETGRYAGRSPPFSALAALWEIPGVHYISLQKESEPPSRLAFPPALLRFPDLDPGPDAFLDSAAILSCVDLLVTTDTAIAHLGGALGVPTWLCLMHDADWRWMRSGDTTPWYRSVRLFRQAIPGDWPGVYAAVARQLSREIPVLKTHREQ